MAWNLLQNRSGTCSGTCSGTYYLLYNLLRNLLWNLLRNLLWSVSLEPAPACAFASHVFVFSCKTRHWATLGIRGHNPMFFGTFQFAGYTRRAIMTKSLYLWCQKRFWSTCIHLPLSLAVLLFLLLFLCLFPFLFFLFLFLLASSSSAFSSSSFFPTSQKTDAKTLRDLCLFISYRRAPGCQA